MHLALYEPDIPQNTGTLLRLAACLGIGIDLIEPAGFVLTDKRLRRAGMDYLDRVAWTRHGSWGEFLDRRGSRPGRLVLLTTRAKIPYTDFRFDVADTLLLGREGAGVPDEIHAAVDAAIRIPMVAGLRSINVALAGAMVVGEALRQTEGFPGEK